jgi:hypothetical protein
MMDDEYEARKKKQKNHRPTMLMVVSTGRVVRALGHQTRYK